MAIIFNDPLWDTAKTLQKVSLAVGRSSRELKKEIKDNIRRSTPRGKIYPRARGFHRASKRGQPPAIDSGKLINSIDDKRLGPLHCTVTTDTDYAAKLEEKMDRPYIESVALKYEPKFVNNIEGALK